MPSQSLAIYLLKPSLSSPRDALDNTKGATPHTVQLSAGVSAELYTRMGPATPPAWTKLFAGATTPALVLLNQSASGVLLLPVGNRSFAVTFGHGRHLLAPGTFDERFGLKVTLNSVDADSIRSIDKTTFDAGATHTRSQTAVSRAIDFFGLDVEQDLLRAVVGVPTPQHAILGSRISGMDSLQLTVNTDLGSLPHVLAHAHAQYQSTAYKSDYPWVDNVAEVRDSTIQLKLDADLATRVNATPVSGVWLAVPKVIDWDKVHGFKYSTSKRAPSYPDLHLRDFLNHWSPRAPVDISTFRQRKIFAVNDNGLTEDSWTAYRCLNAELALGTRRYLLSDGKWYEIDASFLTTVENSYKAIPRSARGLLDFNHATESDYLQDAATAAPDLHLMDQNWIYHGGRSSRFELCDLLSDRLQLIHVKRYGTSAVFSHHFAQGLTVAELLLDDKVFCSKAQAKVPASLQSHFAFPLTPQDLTVTYAVVSWKSTSLELPFFSKVNLRNVVRRLTTRGYKVELLHVVDKRP